MPDTSSALKCEVCDHEGASHQVNSDGWAQCSDCPVPEYQHYRPGTNLPAAYHAFVEPAHNQPESTCTFHVKQWVNQGLWQECGAKAVGVMNVSLNSTLMAPRCAHHMTGPFVPFPAPGETTGGRDDE